MVSELPSPRNKEVDVSSGLALLPLPHGDSTLVVIVSVEEIGLSVPNAATVVTVLSVLSVLSAVSGQLAVEATVLPHLVVETTLLVRMIDETETVIEKEIETTMTAAVLAAPPIVSVTEKIATAVTMIVMPLPTVTTEKVPIPLPLPPLPMATTSSCPGTEADTRISRRLSTTSSR